MKVYKIVILLSIPLSTSCTNNPSINNAKSTMNKEKITDTCTKNCETNTKEQEEFLSCKLTSPELQKRKETILKDLRKKVLEKTELVNGYKFKFAGTDTMLNELIDFIKTERACCNFFTFNLSVTGDQSAIWMELTGPKNAKEFITTELAL